MRVTSPILSGMLVAAALFAAPSSPSAGETFPGWTAALEADATMEKGRHFDCADGACPPDGLACLQAKTPEPPPGARRIRQEDLTRRHAMPWSQIEAWMATRIALLKPDLADDPQVTSHSWSFTEPPHAETLAGKPVVLRRYGLRTAAASYVVPTAFWVDGERMNIVLCLVGEDAAKLSQPRIAELVAALNKTPPAPPPGN